MSEPGPMAFDTRPNAIEREAWRLLAVVLAIVLVGAGTFLVFTLSLA